jgi:hypothetical protein
VRITKKEIPMLKKFTSIAIVAALVYALAGTPTSATAQTRRDTKTLSPLGIEENQILSENLGANQNLRADMVKLVADVRAEGKLVKVPAPQIQAPQRNNLSTGAKIAIGVAIAVAVVVVVLVAQRCNNEPGGC